MSHKILIGCMLTTLFVTGCASQPRHNLALNSSPENMQCITQVQTYLDSADMKGKGVKIKQGDAIVVDYIGRLEDGTVFDTSIEAIAQACDKYSPQRDYTTGLPFTVGAGQMIAGFDAGVIDMKAGQTKTIQIPAAQAYGERDESYLVPVPKNSFSGADTLQPGEQVTTSMGQAFTVHQIDEENIILDANHPLAGKDLIFDITIKSIN